MAQYRKKPVVIEATQWFKMGDHAAVLNNAWHNRPYIKTFEGHHLVTSGEWIITEENGNVYACEPDIFEMTYEAA